MTSSAAPRPAPDRAAWLEEQRRASQQRYDDVLSPTYDQDDPPIDEVHAEFVAALLDRCPTDGAVLDAPCGTGRYFASVLERGLTLVGCDQSAGMLTRAVEKHPDVEVHRVGLQELAFEGRFDAAMCVDAMEGVPPEQWPLVLANVRRSLRQGGHLYLTVEMTDADWLATVFASATAAGLPVVPGEDTTRGGEYHFYPPLDDVRDWLTAAGFTPVAEAHSDGAHWSYSYQHFLARRDGG